MMRQLHSCLLLIKFSLTLAAKDADLPLCPSGMQYFPQDLPMHCRMPNPQNGPPPPGHPPNMPFPTMPPPFYRSPPPGKQPSPIPIPIPPFPGPPPPGMPPGMMPGPMPGPMPMPMPGPMPGMMPMPMPMPVVGGQPHKLPVIVMPFYSQDHLFKKPPKRKPDKKKKKKKKKKPQTYESDTERIDTTSDNRSERVESSDDDHEFWRPKKKMDIYRSGRRHNEMMDTSKRTGLLTPILQYVTKDGYVIFEKKISKNEAKDWLGPKTNDRAVEEASFVAKYKEPVQPSAEESTKVLEKSPPKYGSMELAAEPERNTPRVRMRRNRQKKINNLMSKPGPMP